MYAWQLGDNDTDFRVVWHGLASQVKSKIFHQLFYDYFRNWNTVFPCVSAHALGHNVKQVPPPPIPQISTPPPPPSL